MAAYKVLKLQRNIQNAFFVPFRIFLWFPVLALCNKAFKTVTTKTH